MKYQVTCLHNSDYCKIQPSDKDCQYSFTIEANSKEEARMLVHKNFVMDGYGQAANNLPMVWEVK